MPGQPLMPGFFGKLPGHGDFVQRGLPASFVQPFDAWLQAAIAGSRARLGEGWLPLYLIAPAWRFALAAEVAGPDAVAGVLIPSVDRVGRYFPFALACALPAGTCPIALHAGAEGWFGAAEELALAALETARGAEALLERLEALGQPEVSPQPAPAAGLHADPAGLAPRDLAWVVALRLMPPWSLWWTIAGSQAVAPAILACQGLPEPSAFAAFLDGEFAASGFAEAAA